MCTLKHWLLDVYPCGLCCMIIHATRRCYGLNSSRYFLPLVCFDQKVSVAILQISVIGSWTLFYHLNITAYLILKHGMEENVIMMSTSHIIRTNQLCTTEFEQNFQLPYYHPTTQILSYFPYSLYVLIGYLLLNWSFSSYVDLCSANQLGRGRSCSTFPFTFVKLRNQRVLRDVHLSLTSD